MKQTWNPGTMLSPLPPALIASGDMTSPNVMTAAWTGIICSDPVITYVSIRPSRYSHELISKSKEFTINVPTWKIASEVDTVGVKTGRNFNKFASTGLTPEPCTKISAPQIKECPISMECKVLEIRPFGTHDMFLAEVVAVNVDEQYIDTNGALDLEKAGLLAYAHGFYYTLGRKIGKFGFSVEKKQKTLELSTPLPQKEEVLETTTNKDEETKEIKRFSDLKVVVKKNKFSKENTEKKFQKLKSKQEDTTPSRKPNSTTPKNKFSKEKAENKFQKLKFEQENTSPTRRPNSATPKNKFSKNSTFTPKEERPTSTSRSSQKFSQKTNKRTNYTETTYKKKSDGSFKRNKLTSKGKEYGKK